MPLLKWDEDYNTGICEMDDQHKKWMVALNKFYDQMNGDKTPLDIEGAFHEVIQCTMHHFIQEEALMKKYGYPDYEKQKREHERISGRLFEYKMMLEQGWFNISPPVVSEIKSWFNSHIIDMDKEYSQFIE